MRGGPCRVQVRSVPIVRLFGAIDAEFVQRRKYRAGVDAIVPPKRVVTLPESWKRVPLPMKVGDQTEVKPLMINEWADRCGQSLRMVELVVGKDGTAATSFKYSVSPGRY